MEKQDLIALIICICGATTLSFLAYFLGIFIKKGKEIPKLLCVIITVVIMSIWGFVLGLLTGEKGILMIVLPISFGFTGFIVSSIVILFITLMYKKKQ